MDNVDPSQMINIVLVMWGSCLVVGRCFFRLAAAVYNSLQSLAQCIPLTPRTALKIILAGIMGMLWWSISEIHPVFDWTKLKPFQMMMMLDNCGPLPLSHLLEIIITLVLLERSIVQTIALLFYQWKSLVLSGKKAVQFLANLLLCALPLSFQGRMSFQSTSTYRGFHLISGIPKRLFIFLKRESTALKSVVGKFCRFCILLMMLIPKVAAFAIGCPSACDENPDRYCISNPITQSECRKCEVTCGNAYHVEECKKYCKGSQYFPGIDTPTGPQLASSSSSSSASLPVPSSVGTVEADTQLSTQSVDKSGISLEVSPTAYVTDSIRTAASSSLFGHIMLVGITAVVIIGFYLLFFRLCIKASPRSQGKAVEKRQGSCQNQGSEVGNHQGSHRSQGKAVEKRQESCQNQGSEVRNHQDELQMTRVPEASGSYQTARPMENGFVQESPAGENHREGMATSGATRSSTAKPEAPNKPYNPESDPEGIASKLAFSADSACAPKNAQIDESSTE